MDNSKNNEPIKLYFGKYNDKSFEHFKYTTEFIKTHTSKFNITYVINEYYLIFLAYKFYILLPDMGYITQIFNFKKDLNKLTNIKNDDVIINKIISYKNDILYYKFVNYTSFCLWELNQRYDIIQKNYNYIYEISSYSYNTLGESIMMFYDKYFPTKQDIKINSINLDFLMANNEIKNISNDVMIGYKKILKNVYFTNIHNMNEYILFLDKIKKIDIIFLNFEPIITIIGTYAQYNIMRMFELYTFLKIINKISTSGSIYINLHTIVGKKHLKLISFYCSFFKEYHIVLPKLAERDEKCLYLILKDKKEGSFDSSKLLEIIANNAPMLGINNKIFNPETDLIYSKVKTRINTKIYFSSFDENIINKIKINDNNIKTIYKNLSIDFKNMIKHHYHNMLIKLDTFNYLYDKKINGTLTETEINNIKLKNIEACKEWARRYNMPLAPKYSISHYDVSYENIIYRDIVSFENDIIFRFKSYDNTDFDIEFTTKDDFGNLPISFEKMIGKSREDKKAFEYRNADTYRNIKKKIDYYYKKITYVIALTYDLPNDCVNNDEWLRILEILNKINIIDTSKTNLKSFHICEFAGLFINAISFFLNIKAQNILWSWKAQRLNPKNEQIYDDNFITNNLDILDDREIRMIYDEQMLNTYSDNYDYGLDNTGDITKYDNIQYYRKNHNDYDLVTAGCGTTQTNTGYILSYSQYLMIFSCCKVGGNAILKKIFPIENTQELSMLYLFYSLFKSVIIYKPKINYHSQEYFLVGLNYKGIDTKLLDKLIDFLKEYKTVGFITSLPNTFTLQVDKAQNELIENMNKFIKKQIYFCDNFNNITEEEWNILRKAIKEKIKDWINDI